MCDDHPMGFPLLFPKEKTHRHIGPKPDQLNVTLTIRGHRS